jgi:thiol-disulfide isomerase/thioredoxin
MSNLISAKMRSSVKLICVLAYFFIPSFLYSQSVRAILEETKKKIYSIENCEEVYFNINPKGLDTTFSTFKCYFQKNILDSVFGYSFISEEHLKNNVYGSVYDGFQGVWINPDSTFHIRNKDVFLSNAGDFLITTGALIKTILSSDSVKISLEPDIIINNTLHFVIHVECPNMIGLGFIIKTIHQNTPTQIDLTINSVNYFPQVIKHQIDYPMFNMTNTTILVADTITMVEKKYAEFDYSDFIPNGYRPLSSENEKIRLDTKNPPLWKLQSLSGESISLLSLRGKVVLVDFFSLWCGPCRKATPEIDKMREEFSEVNIVFLGIDVSKRTNKKELQKYVDENNIKYPFLIDGEKVESDYGIFGIPTFILFNKQGQVSYIKTGFSNNVIEEIRNEITKLIAN